MSTNRYCNLLQQQCAEIEDLAYEINRHLDASEEAPREKLLQNALKFFSRLTYVDMKGMHSAQEAAQTRRGNCISISCLMALTLEKLGIACEDMYVCIGARVVDPDRVHAYLLLRGGRAGQFFVIDPEFRKLVESSVEKFSSKYRIHAIFNRNRIAVNAGEKQWVFERLASTSEVSAEA